MWKPESSAQDLKVHVVPDRNVWRVVVSFCLTGVWLVRLRVGEGWGWGKRALLLGPLCKCLGALCTSISALCRNCGPNWAPTGFLALSVRAQELSHFWLFVTPQSVAWQAPLSMNTGVVCHFLLRGIFSMQGSNPHLLCLLLWQADSLPLHHLGSTSPLSQLPRELSEPKRCSFLISCPHSELEGLCSDLSVPWAPLEAERLLALFHSSGVSHIFWVIRCTRALFKNRFPEILETLSQQVWGEARNTPGWQVPPGDSD